MLRALLDMGDFGKLTSFFSSQYLVLFLPAVLGLYVLTPNRFKKYTLLLGSFGFFFLISRRYIVYLLATIVLVWLFGLWLDALLVRRDAQVKAAERPQRKAIKQVWQKKLRLVLALAVTLQIGLLLVLKYSGFFVENVNKLLNTGFRIPDFVVPIGISFFSLSAVSYLVDVCRGTVKADRNIARLALFLSFFPQIVEGPICRYAETAQQLWEAKPIAWDNFTLGIQRIGYGLMKKLVVADRLNAFIEAVFGRYEQLQGGMIAIAAVCYTVQLYMDFSGAMDAVCGTAQIFGFTMPENFRQPFFSKTVSEFWTRWHISLGGFFKDFIFYPVSMSKPVGKLVSKVKKRFGNYWAAVISAGIAFFCVWFCNGLWHGASWSYIFFGMYHFALIFLERVFAPWSKWTVEKLRIQTESKPFKLFQVLRTCVLVVIGELFFRAEGLMKGFSMFARMVTDFRFTDINAQLLNTLSIDPKDFAIVAMTLVIVFAVSAMKERGIQVRQLVGKQHVILRWAIWYALLFYIITFGAYGVGYIPVDPMYANF
jgi:D-alanyl-lipoteichoic acid acyltransferase DltB (MBOAT superfamily)